MFTGINALTIDVEDYFQVHAFSRTVRIEDWPRYECRVEQNTQKILGILSESGIRATFFILGWIAERYPGLVKMIAEQGHEIASHGYRHELVGNQTPDQFRTDVAKTKQVLEGVTGGEIMGYRASTYSITKETSWALQVLAEEGHKYDSSIFPVLHDVYGFPEAPRFPFRVNFNGHANNPFPGPPSKAPSPSMGEARGEGGLWEFPISTVRVLGQNLPVAGGGYFRLFPYWLTRTSLKHINDAEGHAFIFYVHPWEFDPGQPRVEGAPVKARFRHYLNLAKVEDRFRRLLHDFKFAPVRDLIQERENAGKPGGQEARRPEGKQL
ncbi:MAG: XrtA system polysaccharide deacetylase [Pseudomonadota bacterium]